MTKKHEPTSETRTKVNALASVGTPQDQIDDFLRGEFTPESSIVVEVNINSNPFAGETLKAEYEADKQRAIQMQEAGDSGDQSRSGGA